jgi:xanthine dehydrogenase accessory factor
MALRADGSVAGSVSGGCIEDDLIHRFTRAYAGFAPSSAAAPLNAQVIPQGPPAFTQYGLTADEAHRFGLPCGGTLELLLEFDPPVLHLEELVRLLEQGQLVRRTVALGDGAARLQPTDQADELRRTATQLSRVFGPGYRMLLIGAGQLTAHLAAMAQGNGFAVTVCDPRQEYLGSVRVPGVETVTSMPDDAVQAFRPDGRSCVIALTHDPKLDDLALLEALHSDAFYVGAIGSRRNSAARHQRLIDHFGESAETLKHLRGPIGLFIGSKTPSEIAVSVMAEVLAVKNGVALPQDLQVGRAKQERENLAGEFA